MEIKFQICDKVYYLNTVTGKVDKAEVKGVQVMPTGISRDANGESVLDGEIVLYQTIEGPTLAASEVFGSAEEAKEEWKKRIAEL